MSKRKQIKMEQDGNLLRIGNKWYEFVTNTDGDFRTGTHILVEVNKKKIDKQIELITNKLFSFINPKIVLKDALKDVPEKQLNKLYFKLKNNKMKVKPKIEKHCVRMKVAGINIPIRG